MYALVDCNNFYASCERVFQPHLRGVPLVVLSNNDGCAIARSNEAKKLGIKMGASWFEIKPLTISHNLQVRSSNYALYADMSNSVMSLLKEFTPDVEVYSIDECFCRFHGHTHSNLDAVGLAMHRRIKDGTGIPTSIGFATTRALAKVANKIAKKFPERTNNYYIIDSEEKRIKALKWTEIGDVWGIGRQHSKRLQSIGIMNAYQFTQLNDAFVRKHFSVVGLRLKKDLEGIPTIQDEEIKNKKNIACTRSFDNMMSSLDDLHERISTYTAYAAEKLRKQNSHCQLIHVFMLSNQFRRDLPQYNGGFTIKLPFPTSSTMELNRHAQKALEIIYRDGISFKKARVILMGITKDETQQLSMFEYENPKEKIMMKVIDKLNLKLGGKAKFGDQDLKRKWKMNQDYLSPCFTTRVEDIITVKAI